MIACPECKCPDKWPNYGDAMHVPDNDEKSHQTFTDYHQHICENCGRIYGNKTMKNEDSSQEPKTLWNEFILGQTVKVYDRYRFASNPMIGCVAKFSSNSDGVEVRLQITNNSNFPVGSTVWVSEKQLRATDTKDRPTPNPISDQSRDDSSFLLWLHSRLDNANNEDPDADFMVRLKNIATGFEINEKNFETMTKCRDGMTHQNDILTAKLDGMATRNDILMEECENHGERASVLEEQNQTQSKEVVRSRSLRDEALNQAITAEENLNNLIKFLGGLGDLNND